MIHKIEFLIDDPIPDPIDKWIGCFAIQMNIIKRIKKINSINFTKWVFILANGEISNSHIQWEGKKNMRIILFINFSEIKNCKEIKYVKLIYERLFMALSYVWDLKAWDSKELTEIFKDIKREDYRVFVTYGRQIYSPDKKYKAEFICELYPDYADVYVQLTGKRNTLDQRIKIIKTNLNPDMFFGFFTGCKWENNEVFLLIDLNKEIFYTFNVNSSNFYIDYKPVYNSLRELENYVKAFEAGISREESNRLLGLTR